MYYFRVPSCSRQLSSCEKWGAFDLKDSFALFEKPLLTNSVEEEQTHHVNVTNRTQLYLLYL